MTETAAINVGSRLVAMDQQGRVTRIEDAARLISRAHRTSGFATGLGPSAETQRILAERMADCLSRHRAAAGSRRWRTSSLNDERGSKTSQPLDVITGPRGVGQMLGLEAPQRGFAILFPRRGRFAAVSALQASTSPPPSDICADTAIGAAQYTLAGELGRMIYATDPEAFAPSESPGRRATAAGRSHERRGRGRGPSCLALRCGRHRDGAAP